MIKTINSAQTTKKDNENQPIVQIKNVTFSYPVNYFDPQNWLSNSCTSSTKQNKNLPVLNGISFSAPKGQITALLGASGCGKTTLLKLILGLLAPQGGQVTVLGSTPGSQGGNSREVPGPGVGYLPQQVAMPEGHFTITELLTYFGRLRGMSSGEINSQISKLLTLLELPSPSSKDGDSQPVFSKLSGGQQRRVSLAAALLNSPPLLVLDEPTVGVDPLLREIIWRHLRFLAEEEGVTVIITTHYIEEANSADVVALMRSGVLLAEQNPRTLLIEQECSSIEEVFLKLSVQQDEQLTKPEISVNKTSAKIITSELNQQQQKSTFNFSNLFKLYRLQALLSKNLAYYTQNLLSTFLLLIIPTFFLCLSLQVFQNAPKNLPVAVINEEKAGESSKTLISSFFYHQNFKSIKLVNLSSVEQAVEQIIRGKAIGAIHFSENFTSAFERRQKMLLKVDPETIERSSAHLYLDLSNFVLGSTALVHLLQGFAGSIQEHFASIGLNPNAFSLPVRVQEVVYGSIDLRRLTDPIVPGFMLLYVFFMNGALTAIHLVLERKSGLFERIQASGVTLFELQLSHLLVQCLFIVVQSGPLFGFLLLNGSFQFPEGSFAAVLVIYLLEGVAGVVYGLLLSVLFEEAFVVLCSLMGGVMTVVILGDVYWPVEFIPPSLSFLAKVAFPVTGSLKALKGVLFRGWALSKAVVLVNGVLLPVAWMVACLGLTVAVVKVKKRMVK